MWKLRVCFLFLSLALSSAGCQDGDSVTNEPSDTSTDIGDDASTDIGDDETDSCLEQYTWIDSSVCDLEEPRVYVYPASTVSKPDGLSWTEPLPRIQDGLELAGCVQRHCDRDVSVWVAPGIYRAVRTSDEDSITIPPHVHLYGGVTVGSDDLEGRSTDSYQTVIVAYSSWSDVAARNVVTVSSGVTLDGFTLRRGEGSTFNSRGLLAEDVEDVVIRNCNFEDFYLASGGGAAVSARDSSLEISSSRFLRNETADSGDSVLEASQSTLVFDDCTFEGNMSGSEVVEASQSTLTFDDCTFGGNSSTVVIGVDEGALTVRNVRFNSNRGIQGESYRVIGAGGARLTVEDSTFSENWGKGIRASGGSLSISRSLFEEQGEQGVMASNIDPSELRIEDSQFLSNQEQGVHLHSIRDEGAERALISRCYFQGNQFGIYNGSGDIRVENSVFAGQSYAYFSPSSVHSMGGDMLFESCTFRQNHPDGHIFVGHGYTPFTATNSIFRGINPSDYFAVQAPSVVSIQYSNVQGGFQGEGNIDADPLFTSVNLRDYTLTAGSPCIDAANSALAPASDMLGTERHDDPDSPNTGIGPPWADMGAYEYVTAP